MNTTYKHSLSVFTYLVSTSVRVLEANAMGNPFCMKAAARSHSVASLYWYWLGLVIVGYGGL